MILCAAVKIHVDATGKDVVIPCRRHCDAFHILRDMGFEPKQGYKTIAQGFITTSGMFLDRKQAYRHAVSCGQLSDTVMRNVLNEELFSEDLY
jgi:hypothetical protein